MSKQVIYGDEARQGLKRGVDTLANAVKVTLGPGGKNVSIDNDFLLPNITKDGVTVARSISLDDPLESQGVEMIKEGAINAEEESGDGTTTTVVLTQALLEEGFKNLSYGANPVAIKKGMDKALVNIRQFIKDNSVEVGTDLKKINSIASISANNDAEIGKLITSTFKKVGMEGEVKVESHHSNETIVEHVNGLSFDHGYLSNYFITDKVKSTANHNEPYVLIFDGTIHSLKILQDVLNEVAGEDRDLLLFVEGIDPSPLAALCKNKLMGNLRVTAVTIPGFGDTRDDYMYDLAAFTGSKVISELDGSITEPITLAKLGECKHAEVKKDSIVLFEGKGSEKEFKERILNIKERIKNEEDLYLKGKLSDRLTRLTNGVAVIKVGAPSSSELAEKMDRVIDAVLATKSAIEEGVSAGGGLTLLRASQNLMNLKVDNDDEAIGIKIVKKALEAPLRQIVNNAGGSGDMVIEKVKTMKGNKGYNAKTDTYGDLLKKGIVDATKVTRVAIEQAISIASIILTIDATVVNEPIRIVN